MVLNTLGREWSGTDVDVYSMLTAFMPSTHPPCPSCMSLADSRSRSTLTVSPAANSNSPPSLPPSVSSPVTPLVLYHGRLSALSGAGILYTIIPYTIHGGKPVTYIQWIVSFSH